MRAITIAAAAAALFVSGSAYAKCSTADLAGPWVVDLGIPWQNSALIINVQCDGSMTKAGKLITSSCTFMHKMYQAKMKLELTVNNACKVTGTSKVTITNLPMVIVDIDGFVGGGGDQMMADATDPDGLATYNGTFRAMRIGN